MKKFITENFTIIVFVLLLLAGFKSCNDNRKITKMSNEIKTLETYMRDSLVNKTDLIINGLETEKRMIQATDRKILDVNRQNEIENEIKRLKGNK